MRKGFNLLKTIKQVQSLPSVEIELYGPGSYETYRSFTKKHPKYKIIQRKKWGVALLELPDTFEDYLKGKKKQVIRTNRNRALKEGFYYDTFEPFSYLEDILSINCSTPSRQGRIMDSSYLDMQKLREYFIDKPLLHGVFNKQGKLRAYAHTSICGDVFIFSRLLGHAEDLDKGVMYLLISSVIEKMIALKISKGYPLWAMYDTYYGASKGLQYFKDRLGFKPYKVKWRWVGDKEDV